MNTYQVVFESSNSVTIEVEAESHVEAGIKAENKLAHEIPEHDEPIYNLARIEITESNTHD